MESNMAFDSKEKLPYRAPKLIVYGTVEEITLTAGDVQQVQDSEGSWGPTPPGS